MNLVELVTSQLSPELVNKLGGAVGESPATVTRAAYFGIPTILGSIVREGSTETGARGVLEAIRAGGYDTMEPSSLLDRDDTRAFYLQRGQGLLTPLFGTGLDSTVSGLSSGLGISRQSTSGILAALAPFVLSVIGRYARTNNLSPAELASLFRSQSVSTREVTTTRRTTFKAKRSWLWPALAVGVAVFGGALLCSRERADFSMTKPSAPIEHEPPIGGGPVAPEIRTPAMPETPSQTEEQAPGIDALQSYLEGGAKGTGRFELEGLTFETNSANLTDGGRALVARVAESLAEHPDVNIRVDGFTDNTGPTEVNQQLSQARALTVRNELVARGVDLNRIQATGHGPENPIASNDTDDGRAKNRRTEVTLQRK